MERPGDETKAGEWNGRNKLYAWWVVVVLALALTLSLMDRMIIALMIIPIQRDLGLTDTEVSLVHGLAFTILYVFAGFPLGRLADRGNRRSLAALSVIAWSAMTALCGAAQNFIQLFLARMGVGVGEAGLSPAAVSLVSDYFPAEERARPLSFLSIGTTAGAGIALMIGGAIVHLIGSSGRVDLPLFGTMQSWQAVFVILGVGGIAFAALFLTVREPPRRERSYESGAPSPREVAATVLVRWKFFVPQFLGPALCALVLIGFHSWMPTMLIRHFGWTTAQAGYGYGGLIAIGGIGGILIAGSLSVSMNRKGGRKSEGLIAACAAAGAFPFLAAAPLMPSGTATLATALPGIALLTIPPALAPAILQGAVPNEMRGQVFALHLFVLSLLGYAAGPILVAFITEGFWKDQALVHLSLSAIAVVALPLAALSQFAARRNSGA
ncbi:MFS transporter [Sphingopyxis sp.]|jgi:MFS family permease|uniref:MFS transporter n=1 Tax=Sphingopyxis sp. TaxID=1908224 RepID=UPI001D272180|nr:MFS transporter [Sphingopyxis sp.]MBW8296345.1 MFS transporter [Sphingopyxis sp.]